MKGTMHTTINFSIAAFSALYKLSIPVQKVQSPYSKFIKQVDVLCEEYSDSFLPLEGIPLASDVEFCVDLKDEQAAPPLSYCHRLSYVELAEVHNQLANLLDDRWVQIY